MSDFRNSIKPAHAAPREAGTSLPAPEAQPSFLRRLVYHGATPMVLGAVGCLALVLTILGSGAVSLPGTKPDIVVFDPVRFANAQRAAASFLAMNPNNEMVLALTQVAKQAEQVIIEEADGAVVLVRQAVVVPDNYPDITTAVIERFGLDSSVPTVRMAPALSIEDIAPTETAFSRGQVKEEYEIKQQQRRNAQAAEAAKASQQEQVLP